MAKFHVAQNNFNGGVFGRLLLDRYDLPTCENAIKSGKNAFPLTEGPLFKRPGSIFVADVLNNAKARLMSFRFSKDVKYLLEFTPNKIRFFKNRKYLDYSIDTTFTEEMYDDIYTAQLSDLLLMVSTQIYPQQLKRTNDTSWELKGIEFYDGPYMDTNTTDTELYCSGKNGEVNLNSTTDLFSADDVGRHWRLRSGEGWSWGVCTKYVNARQINITVKEGEMPVSPYQTKLWKKGVFSKTQNRPSTICLYANRLWLGGFKENPALVVASKTGDFFNFAPADIGTTAIAENNAVSINLSASGVSDIQFIAGSDKGLDIGTSEGIWIVGASGGFVDQSSFAALKNSQGAAGVKPIVTGPSVVYVQRSGKKLMDIQYSFTEDGYNAPELSLFNRDYMKNGIKYIEYQQDPISCIWCLDNQGKIFTLNYDKNQSVYAWIEQDFGDEVESFTVIPSIDGSSEDIWLSVKRIINGEAKRYIEYVPSWEEMFYTDRNKLVYCDCAIIQNYPDGANELTGLERIDGREVSVLGNGNYLGSYVVSDGKITLADGVIVSDVVVGIIETFEMSTIDKNYGFTNGTTLHRKKSVSGIKIGLLDSLGGEYNIDGGDKYYPILFFNSSVNLDTNVPLFTGVKDIDLRTLCDEHGTIYIRQTQGLPFCLTSVTFDLENS